MKIIKGLFPFVFILFLGIISARFLFFVSYLQAHKFELREQLITESNCKVIKVLFSSDDLYKDKNGYEWKEENKELVINGIFHEVIAVKKFKDQALVFMIKDNAENSLFDDFFPLNNNLGDDSENLTDFLLDIDYLDESSDLSIILHKKGITLKPVEDHFYDFQFILEQIKPPLF